MAKSAQQIIRESVRRVLGARAEAASTEQITINENWMKIAGLLTEAPDAAVKLVKAYDAKVNKGFKSEAEMQAAKRELAMGLKGMKIIGTEAITEVIEAAGGREEGQGFAAELAAMQK